jgi:hypothetical protein
MLQRLRTHLRQVATGAGLTAAAEEYIRHNEYWARLLSKDYETAKAELHEDFVVYIEYMFRQSAGLQR